jgi:SAM-dependent methyltransferase
MTSEEYRTENRRRWTASAPGWEARADALRQGTMPVSAWMVEAISPQPGQTVLELAAGPGDTGFLAAELIQPGGTLISSDVIPEMLSAAQRRAEALGIRNVRFRQIDAEVIDIEAGSIDGVLCRWGYMLMPDPGSAVGETRRVLRPGGRVALAAWADPEANPWTVLPPRELISRGLLEPPDRSGPGQFHWAPEGAIAEALEGAGFVEYEVEPLDFTIAYPSVRAWWEMTRDIASSLREAIARMDEATENSVVEALEEAVAGWTADDGSVSLPARTWVAVAAA